MYSSWSRLFLIFFLFLFPLTVWGESEVEITKNQMEQTLQKSSFYGEVIETVFQFGRRQEIMYRLWVKKDFTVRQIVMPLWRDGETIINTRGSNLFYIPRQNSVLKSTNFNYTTKNKWRDWHNWVKRIESIDGKADINGKEAIVCSGKFRKLEFKIYVDRDNAFPLGIEFFLRNIKTRSIFFQKIEKITPDFIPAALIQKNVKVYDDETRFWQDVSISRVQAAVNFKILQPTYLPPGFVFKKAVIKELSSATVVHLIYENHDKQIISLFEREKISKKQRLNLKNLKNHSKHLYAYQWFENQVHIALIGSVPRTELKKVIASI